MSKKSNVNDFLFGRRETGLLPTKYNLRSAAAFRTISPNSSSSSDSFDDSFEIYRPKKSTNSNTTSRDEDSMMPLTSESMNAKNKIAEEACDELDELFKNIALKDQTRDNIPSDWLENNEDPLPNNVGLSTVYEGSESKYRSSKSVNSSTYSKDSGHSEISMDSLFNFVKPTETSKDSLDRSYVTSNNVLPIELNDTLEDVEYVCDEKNRYLLKPVSRPSNRIPNRNTLECSSSVDSSVIVVDSSPDISFVTAQNVIDKVIDVKDIKTETLSDKSTLSYDTLTSVDTTKNISLASTARSTDMSFTTAKNDLKLIDTYDFKSEITYDKTASSSDAKINSWTTLDSSEDTATAPLVDERNDSLFMAKNKLKSFECDDIKSETSGEGQMFTCISYPKTASFFELDGDKTIDSDNGKSSEYFTAAASNETTSSTSQPCVSAARYNTLDDIPSFSTDSTFSSVNRSTNPQNHSTDSSRHFNDSLDRMEYMMKKGRELQLQKSNTKQPATEKPPTARLMNSPASQYKVPTPKTLTSSSQKRALTNTAGSKTPAIKTKLFTNSAKKPVHPSPQAVTPATRILKPFNRVQSAKTTQSTERKFISPKASPSISPAFKKPNFPTPTLGTRKEPIQSRLPTTKNKHFEHIVSPIGAYIKNIAAPPLLANVKPTTDFFDSSYCNKMSKDLDYSVMSDAGASKPIVSSLPVKFFTSSEQQRVIDEKFQKIPGGEKLNRIIGQMPSVISHQGRIHSDSPIKKRIAPIDESFANVSVMSGDISVQVVRDVKRH